MIPSLLNLDDLDSLNTRIEEKAFDLFLAKPNSPSLQVIRCCNATTYQSDEADQGTEDIWDISQVQALRVRKSLLS